MSTPDIRIKFTNVEVISLAMFPRPQNWEDGNQYEFDLKVDSQVNPEAGTLIILTDIKVRAFKTDNILASIVVACSFDVENFSDAITKRNDGVYQIPVDVDVVMKTMSVSTIRGIMFSEFKGTYLYRAILPIIIVPPPQIKAEQIPSIEKDK